MNGSWDYGTDWRGKQLKLKDYHQGFMLDSLYFYFHYVNANSMYLDSMAKGMKFYRRKQFFSDGRSVYRYPKAWPTDIHNQAQGIITFQLFETLFPEYRDFSKRIANWTTANMYDADKHYFYYQKWPFYTNKISYMRWNQAWMLFALSHMLSG